MRISLEAFVIDSWPLKWPEGWRRTPAAARKGGRFNKRETRHGEHGSWPVHRELTLNDACGRVFQQLDLFGIDTEAIIISTNIKPTLAGLPRANQRAPDNPGAAVYWPGSGDVMRVIAIDQYDRVADNLAAIAATLEYMRGIERHGGAQILERAFTGFTALPAPGAADQWQQILGFESGDIATIDDVERHFREIAQILHPDRPNGDAALFNRLVKARDEARRALA